MKILLLYPCDFESAKQMEADRLPLGLLYIASYVEEQVSDTSVQIIDCIAENMHLDTLLTRIKEEKPDLIGISASAYFMRSILLLSEKIRSISEAKLVLGGFHVEQNPAFYLEKDIADYIIIGEGELAFAKLCGHLKGNINIADVPNIYYLEDGKLMKSKTEAVIEDLDSLPFPDRSKINDKLYYRREYWKKTSILGSRGCRNNCKFCAHNAIYKGNVRQRSVKNIIAEIQECMRKYHIKAFKFLDSNFINDPQQTEQLCKTIIRQNMRIRWECQTRIDSFLHIKDLRGFIKLLEQSGCTKVFFGMESGSQNILDLNRKNIKIEDAERIIAAIKRSKIEVSVAYVLGLIGETKETLMKTINHAAESPADEIVLLRAYAYPGTEIYDAYKDKIRDGENYWLSDDPLIRRGYIDYGEFTTKELEELIKTEVARRTLSVGNIIRKGKKYLFPPTPEKLFSLKQRLRNFRKVRSS